MVKSKAKLDNLDLFDDLPNPVGRPRQFSSNAERQKAYRGQDSEYQVREGRPDGLRDRLHCR